MPLHKNKRIFFMPKRLLLIFLSLFTVTTTSADFTVRTIYLQPTDAPATPIVKIRNAMESAQKYYADEMQKHKFGRKTFRLERDNSGKIIIHTIRGRHRANHYYNDTEGKLKTELPANMQNKNDILLSFIGGLDLVGGYFGRARCWFGHDCGGCKGWVAIASRNGNFELDTVYHELGHSFGLYHNIKGKQGGDFVMWNPASGRGNLEFHEARWLNKSRYFNTVRVVNLPPRISNMKRPVAMRKNNADYVRFTADIASSHDLYQAQIFADSDHTVWDWAELNSQRVTVDFEVRRTELTGESRVWIQAIDITGNQSLVPVDFTLPEKSKTVITETIETDRTETYLTLSYNSPNALTPTNPQNEWGWDWGGWQQFWEKTPDGKLPPLPHQGFMPAEWIPYVNQWDYFFYAHYPSRIVYDLSSGNYTKFDAYFDMPNPCTHIATPASMEVIFLADGVEIYNTGVFRGNDARNTRITFDIPEDTQTLTITVTDAGDGGVCDHFIFANARLSQTGGTGAKDASNRELPRVRETGRTSVEDATPTTDRNTLVSGKITGPWLWMIAPTEIGKGGALSTDVDSLAVASGGLVTEDRIANNGAHEGDAVGDLEWTLGKITPTGVDNINDTITSIGLGTGDIDDHSSYALITLESDSDQNGVNMRVGSDDSIKVWLNGKVVHKNAVDRGASDFQETFLVNLIAGDNLLLVKVSERGGGWSMFVGIDADINAVYKRLSDPEVSVDVNREGLDPIASKTTETALTLSYESPDALIPTNNRSEWVSHVPLWEKTPDGVLPRIPNGVMDPKKSRQFFQEWDYFFYSHAPSRIVYDLSDGNYESFEALFDMPNPCGEVAAIEISVLADNSEIYNSGLMKGIAWRNAKIGFDIPEDTQTLTFLVSDLGDPGCDHFVFGNAKLIHRTTDTVVLADPAVVSIVPSSVVSPAMGERLTFNLNIKAGNTVAGYQATVRFDTTALRFVSGTNGKFLPVGAFFVDPKVEGNLVQLNAASLAGESDGDGTLATLTFEVITVKASTLTLSDVLLSNSTGETFAPQIENAEITKPTGLKEDVNGDGQVNIADLVLVASTLGETGQKTADVNDDEQVNIADLVLVAGALGTSASAPSLHLHTLEMLTTTEVKKWLSAAQQLDLTDTTSQRGILFLQQLLAVLTPKETALLANYPNPFNPETWVPYHLSKDAEVTITIYGVDGQVVRTLALGHQPAGMYQSRNRAAYWDGKNEFGEPVASGLYFYTLTTGDFTATRRMLNTSSRFNKL